MAIDSLTLIAALFLLAASLFAGGRRGYLRFAAGLAAALALAVLGQGWVAGIAQAAALIVLPLSGAALGLGALARFAKPPPPLFATLCLVLALACGLAALLGASLAPALLPLAAGGAVAMLVALPRGAFIAALAGGLLLAAACAFFARGVASPGLMLLAASLGGFAVQKRVSNRRAALSSVLP